MGRTRTYEWTDPASLAATALTMSGLDFLRALAAGELPQPPIAATLGFSLLEVEEGRAVFACEPGEEHYNPIGSVHGGVYATLADSAAGCAVQSTLPPGMAYTSLDLSIKFLRKVTVETGRFTAVGTVRNRGRRTALAEVELFDSADRLLAHATSSCLLFEVPTAR
ncbi:aromatic compound degradation protein PaaI [Actinomadura craniellae]|uniref:Aromatic compound degradation protein PaaI n=1 Tax=Actinomadura craniellae TaxID=2231787 RepID=A0A365GWF7_9ACTN|nr:PaaI family thioesterase [Actinomadura craniellae]RAY11134.1 aromatic compound degradation protein PaaI [Actinomadura craniellae]